MSDDITRDLRSLNKTRKLYTKYLSKHQFDPYDPYSDYLKSYYLLKFDDVSQRLSKKLGGMENVNKYARDLDRQRIKIKYDNYKKLNTMANQRFFVTKKYTNRDGSQTILMTAPRRSRKVWRAKNGGGIISTTYTVGPTKIKTLTNGWRKVSKTYNGKNGSSWAVWQKNGGKIKRAIRFYKTKQAVNRSTGEIYKRVPGWHASVTTFTPIPRRK